MITVGTGGQLSRRKRLSRLTLLGALLSVLLALLWTPPASAHAQLLSSTPADGAVLAEPPTDVELGFNESVQLLDGSVRLFSGDDAPVILDAGVIDTTVTAQLPGELDQGSYTLSYRVVSADGHPITGVITFTIGTEHTGAPASTVNIDTPGSTQFVMSVLTGLQYVGLLFFSGLVFFDRIVLRSGQPMFGRTRFILLSAGIIGAVASLLLIPVSALNLLAGELLELLTPTVWLSAVLWPPVAVAVIVLTSNSIALTVSIRAGGRAGSRIISAVTAISAVAAPVLAGHTQLVEPRALMMAADLGHLLAGAFWTGGVLGLLLFLANARHASNGMNDKTGPVSAAGTVARFSSIALWSVLLLATSGVIMAVLIAQSVDSQTTTVYAPTLLLKVGLLIVSSTEALAATGYGLTLLLKLGFLSPVIIIAGWNRFRLLPTLLNKPTTRLKWRTLNRTLVWEAALLVVVLFATGFLTNLSPSSNAPHTSAGMADHNHNHNALPLTGQAQGMTVTGTLSPGETGPNVLDLTLEYDGETAAPESVTIRASLPDRDLGPFEIIAEIDPRTGSYNANLALPLAGEWDLQILARVSTYTEPLVTVPVTIR